MEKYNHAISPKISKNSHPIGTQGLMRSISFAIALTMGSMGCTREPCKSIPYGVPGTMPDSNEPACFFDGLAYDDNSKEKQQKFEEACKSKGNDLALSWHRTNNNGNIQQVTRACR